MPTAHVVGEPTSARCANGNRAGANGGRADLRAGVASITARASELALAVEDDSNQIALRRLPEIGSSGWRTPGRPRTTTSPPLANETRSGEGPGVAGRGSECEDGGGLQARGTSGIHSPENGNGASLGAHRLANSSKAGVTKNFVYARRLGRRPANGFASAAPQDELGQPPRATSRQSEVPSTFAAPGPAQGAADAARIGERPATVLAVEGNAPGATCSGNIPL